MSCSTRSIVNKGILAFYVFSQFMSVTCAYAGSAFAVYDYNHPSGRKPTTNTAYVIVFGISISVGLATALLRSKFQGVKIGTSEEDHRAHILYPYDIAPRTRISNLVEISYLIFTTMTLIVDNYFFLTAIEATYKSLLNPSGNYPIIPLGHVGLAILAVKSLLFDLPFKMTNEHYSATEELKEDITCSKAGPLLGKCLRPIMFDRFYYGSIFWIKTAAAMSYVLTNYIGMLLSIPLGTWTFNPKEITIIILMFVSAPLIMVNYLQTLYCDGKESEINLKKIRKNDLFFPHKRGHKSILQKLLTYAPNLTKPIHFGFYTQGIIRGGSDTMPVVFFLYDFFDRLSAPTTPTNWQTGVIATISIVVFLGSLFGTHFSEVVTAIENYKKDFESEEREPSLPIYRERSASFYFGNT